MPIILTSYTKAHLMADGERFSIARFQPKGSTLAELPFLAATGKGGVPLRMKEIGDPARFAAMYREGLEERWAKVKVWMKGLDAQTTVILCCWCPYSDTTRKAAKQGTFYCHSGLIGQMLNRHRPDLTIILDDDRVTALAEEWRPAVWTPATIVTKEEEQQYSLFLE